MNKQEIILNGNIKIVITEKENYQTIYVKNGSEKKTEIQLDGKIEIIEKKASIPKQEIIINGEMQIVIVEEEKFQTVCIAGLNKNKQAKIELDKDYKVEIVE